MGDRLKQLKERSQKRRELLAQQLGLSSPESLRQVLSSKEEQEELEAQKRKTAGEVSEGPEAKKKAAEEKTGAGVDTVPHRAAAGDGEDEEKEEIYTDSSTFLKGTQSANPHNDYCQNFVDTGERPQNYIRDVGLANRFEEYPKLRELIRLKDDLIQQTNTPPMYLKADLETFYLSDLNTKFESILLEPPLEEYQRTLGVQYDKYWSWEEIEKLEIREIAADRSFIWIWCGSSDGLDAGRRCLKKWGYRRCEDICWIKTNIKNPSHNKNLEPKSIFQRTKEHCLMGIKGTVRRSTDGDFIHANVDIDLIIEEETPYGSDEKAVEIFHIIEHFCLGRRRLHIFGRDSTIRPGWVTVGPDLTSSNYEAETYNSLFNSADSYLTGCSDEIERLRPKSPPPKNKGGPNQQGNPKDGGRGGGPPRGRGLPRGGPSPRGAPMPRGGGNTRGMPPRQGLMPRGGWGGQMGYGGRGRGGHRGVPPR